MKQLVAHEMNIFALDDGVEQAANCQALDVQAAAADEGEAGLSPDTRAGIDRTIQVMKECYAEELSRETLSMIAGMSLWHYAHQFKQLVGKSPIDYLNGIRINKAKEQLLQSGLRVKEIAWQVGFEDEIYFSRKFKKTAGVAPTGYAKWTNGRIAAVSFPYAGHLLALGITPYAAFVDVERDTHRRPYFERISYHLRRSKRMEPQIVEYNRNTLLDAKPELILCDDMFDERVKASISAVARTVVIPWLKLEWRQQFRQIAALLGRSELAEGWLSAYAAQAARAGAQLRNRLCGRTISILHVMQGRLVVYGKRNGGAVLYDDLKLNCPYDAASIDIMSVVEQAELDVYTGDVLLLVVDSDEASEHCWQLLRHSKEWQRLPSVKQGNVHPIGECPWLDYSPFAHRMIIEEAAGLNII
jgi:AraC-like DNA-binding protein